ncbi:MAG: Protein translocase subunit SecE [Phycisphaerae bacterium]|nr:Protein translocase subunit SecE [Phycisphaerae bacterium]
MPMAGMKPVASSDQDAADQDNLPASAGGSGGLQPPVTASAGDESYRPAERSLKTYKPGQGYYTRLGTAVGAGALLLTGMHYIWSRLPPENPVVQNGIPALLLILLGGLVAWVILLNRRSGDFFIAVEGEMKKVSWSSRKEIFGSTKVVLVFTLTIAILLFLIDLGFMAFFGAIGVLKINLTDFLFHSGG